MSNGPYTRRSARVLLVDDAERLLLLHFTTSTGQPVSGWVTPGGGVEPDETLSEAAARELWEEIRLKVVPGDLGEPVATTAGHAELGGVPGLFRGDFFFLRTGAHVPDVSGQEAYERRELTGHRWWTLQDLRSTPDLIYPYGVATLLEDLLAGNRIAQPRELPWQPTVQGNA